MANDFPLDGREPLIEYPWRGEVDRLLNWLLDKDAHHKAFCFDVIMSCAYLDAASGIEKSIENCTNAPTGYNSHLGFINLCSPCYESQSKWSYQKAIKPQSGALGKLSSEVILRFIEKLSQNLSRVFATGGTGVADAILVHNNGEIILAEVKSAPLLTYPFLFNLPQSCINGEHKQVTITSSQLRESDSALYLHGGKYIPLGKLSQELWPFKPVVDYLVESKNWSELEQSMNLWLETRKAYANRDKSNKLYYLANASGTPPKIAKSQFGWPGSESISDGKTSAGMDRTDDIKKGIYQTLKIGIQGKNSKEIKTAIISNLPAYRHGKEYISPFLEMLWGLESDIKNINGVKSIEYSDLRRVFDYIILLENPILRNLEL